MWEYGGTDHIVVAVHRVSAPNNRNPSVALGGINRCVVVTIRQRYPIPERSILVLIGKRAATIENATQTVAPNIFWGDMGDLALNHLSNFLL